MRSYHSFAEYYDELMEDARYADRCQFILNAAQRHHHEMGKTLDLACGTGSLTLALAQNGVEVFGVDGSVEMLSQAMQKSLAAGHSILFVNQEMQSLNLGATVDTCVCTLDSLNHITDVAQLQKTFDGVSRYLHDDGLFIFDVNTVYKHREVLANNVFVLENERVFCVWQNTLHDEDIVDIALDFFEEEDGLYYRSSEDFSERAYSVEQLSEMLGKAGLAIEAVYGDLRFESPAEDEQRIIVVARKMKS